MGDYAFPMRSQLLIGTVALVTAAYVVDGIWHLGTRRARREAPWWSEALLLLVYVVFIVGLETSIAVRSTLLGIWLTGNALRFLARRRNGALK